MILAVHPENIPTATGLKAIGYWKSDDKPWLPNPTDYVDTTWNLKEKTLIIKYLKRGTVLAQWKTPSFCRMGCLPAFETNLGYTCLTDGVYVWPEGFAHYIERHYVKPPRKFTDYVHKRSNR